MANEWYVQHGGKEHGPLTSAVLKKLASEGKITPATSVRLGAGGNWVPASRVQGLFGAAQAPAAKPAGPTAKPAGPAAQAHAAKSTEPPSRTPPPRAASQEVDPLFDLPPPPPPQVAGRVPVAAAVPLPRAVPADSGSVTPKIIGGVAVILGTVALATCWLPMMGGLIGWTGIAMGGLGLIIGASGLALAARHKGAGLMLNISGTSSAAVGLVLSVVLGVAFGMFTGAPPPKPVVIVQPALKPVIPAPRPVKLPEPPPEPVWTDASQPIQQGDITAQVMWARIEKIALESSDLSTLKKQKPQPMLKIKVAIENTSTDKILEFTGWVGGGDLIGQGVGQLLSGSELGKAVQSAAPTAQLSDNIGNKYKQTPSVSIFGSALSVGKDNSLRPGKTAEADLVFPEPLPAIEYLRLELSPAAFGGSEPLRFQIPKAMIKGFSGQAGLSTQDPSRVSGGNASRAVALIGNWRVQNSVELDYTAIVTAYDLPEPSR